MLEVCFQFREVPEADPAVGEAGLALVPDAVDVHALQLRPVLHHLRAVLRHGAHLPHLLRTRGPRGRPQAERLLHGGQNKYHIEIIVTTEIIVKPSY